MSEDRINWGDDDCEDQYVSPTMPTHCVSWPCCRDKARILPVKDARGNTWMQCEQCHASYGAATPHPIQPTDDAQGSQSTPEVE